MSAYRAAIERTVRPGDVVADLGSGSGVLGMMCARAGAARVFCVERNEYMIGLARGLARDNGFGDRLEFLHTRIEDLTAFPAPVDVIVSETMGAAGMDEGIFQLFSRCVSLLPRPPRCLPTRVRVLAAPLAFPELALRASRGKRVEGLDFSSLAAGVGHIPQVLPVTPGMLLAPPRTLFSGELGVDLAPERLEAAWDPPPSGSVDAIGLWFSADLADGIILSNGPEGPDTHWNQLVLPVLPGLGAVNSPLELVVWPRFVAAGPRWKWSLTWGENTHVGDPATLDAPESVEDWLKEWGVTRLSVSGSPPREP